MSLPTSHCLYGQNCEAGWGYDAENGLIIKNPGLTGTDTFTRPILAKTKGFNINSCNFFTFASSPDTSFIESLVGKNENAFKFMNFIIQNWNTIGFISEITALTKFSYISDPPVSYPMKATHYIKEVTHGLQMFVILDERNRHLFVNRGDVRMFLNKIWRQQTSLSDEQKNVKCSVLIFSSNHEKTIIKKMTMLEIRELLSNVENGEYSDFVGSVQCILEPVPNFEFPVISEIAINTVETQLFQLYQKGKLLDEELDLLESSSYLKKSSNEFKEKKKQLELLKSKYDKLWDLRIGQCASLLQGSKLTDFELCFGSPLDKLEIKSKPQNEFVIEKIGPMMNDQIIMMGKDYFYSLDPEMAKKLKMGIFLSNEDGEPFVSIKNLDKKILIGFASHKNRFTSDELDASEMFVTLCPKKCTLDERQWICVTCGNFFKIKNFEVVCDCGTTHVTNLKLECFDPKHPKTILPSSLKSCSTSGISTPQTTSSPTLE